MKNTRCYSLPMACLVAACGALAPASAFAGPINGSFESGTLTGWSALGDVSVQTDSFGPSPTSGQYDALLTTLGTNDVDAFFQSIDPYSGTAAQSAAALEGALGLGSGSIGGTEGSLLHQSFTVEAGDVLEFDWNFFTDESLPPIGYNDYAFLIIDGNIVQLSSAQDSLGASSSPFFRESGWQTYSHTFLASGTVSLGFGVIDMTDELVASALMLDSVTLLTDSTVVVPEPATGTLMLLGAAAFCARRAFRHRCHGG